MTRSIKIIMAVMCLVTFLMSCSVNVAGIAAGMSGKSGSINNGDVSKATVNKTVTISKFNKIEASQGIQIIFTQGKFTGTAQVRTTPSAEKYLRVEVNNGVLEVRYDSFKGDIDGPSIIRVQAPDLSDIDLGSAASVIVEGQLNISNKLSIDLTSAASVTLNSVKGKSLSVDQTSASSVSIGDLNLDSFSLEMTSASNASIGKVTATKMSVETTSAATCVVKGFNGSELDTEATSGSKIAVSNIKATEVDAMASSGATISLSGECGNIDASASSGATIERGKLYSNRKPAKNNSTKDSSDKVMPQIP